jgi:UPF0755 protein
MNDLRTEPGLHIIHTNFKTNPRRNVWWIWIVCGAVALTSALLMYVSWLNTPAFNTTQTFIVEEGQSAKMVADRLEAEGLIRSGLLFYMILLIQHDPTTIKASTYVFDTPLSSTDIANRLTTGDFDSDLLRLTLIEGERAEFVAARAATVLPEFDAGTFLELALIHEGELFPDTYFVPTTYTAPQLLSLLLATFAEKTESIAMQLDSHPLGRTGVLTVASIVEREANTEESMRLVAGILRNRLELGMPLQTDASIEYVLDTPLNELKPGELATILETLDSPYNTYLYAGLPPTPIGNPGLEAIVAVLEPIESGYFYYITGDDGAFYYAETYDEHLDNIARYLR